MRYVVTGGAGHVGRAVVARLAALEDTELVGVADVQPTGSRLQNVDSDLVDVRDADRLTTVIERRRPDAIVHLASSHDAANGREQMYETNVVGTNGVLAAAAAARTPHVLILSSAACYGVGDASEPVTEAAALRSNLESDLARDRATVDRLAQLFAARHADRTLTIVRPCAVIGSAENDATARLFVEPPYSARLAPPAARVQLLHEDDFVESLVRLALGRHGGLFNVAGDGVVTLGECAEMVGLRSRRGPLKTYSKLRPRKGGRESFDDLDLLLGTPVVSTERLRTATEWTPRHSSREAFQAAMGARGKLVDATSTPAAPQQVADPALERS